MADATLPGFEETLEDKQQIYQRSIKESLEEEKAKHEKIKHSIAMPVSALKAALSTNQFKNVFQPGNIDSIAEQTYSVGGYKINRKEAEQDYFGIPYDAPGSKRPVYGFMRHTDTGFPHDITTNYGDALVDINKNLSGHVTATEGDSLNRHMTGHEAEDVVIDEPKSVHPDDVKYMEEQGQGYYELQYHDRPKPKRDIEQVNLATRAEAKTPIGSNLGGISRTPSRGLNVADGVLDKAPVDQAHAAHQAMAEVLRASGLSAPVVSRVRYSYREPGLFDNLPERGYWGDIVHDESIKEV